MKAFHVELGEPYEITPSLSSNLSVCVMSNGFRTNFRYHKILIARDGCPHIPPSDLCFKSTWLDLMVHCSHPSPLPQLKMKPYSIDALFSCMRLEFAHCRRIDDYIKEMCDDMSFVYL